MRRARAYNKLPSSLTLITNTNFFTRSMTKYLANNENTPDMDKH